MSQPLQDDSRPLTDQERSQLTRLLSDPTVYPQTFKNWLVPYLEASDMVLPMQNVHGLVNTLVGLGAPLGTPTERFAVVGLPTGMVLLFDGPAAPDGTEFHPDPAVQAAAPPGLKFIRVL